MNYSLYFERVPKGKKAEEFQYPGPDDLPAWQYWFGEMLYRNTFVLQNKLVDQSDYKVKFINDFLSYHFNKHDDNVDQFIICIRSIQDYIEMECLKKAPFDLNAWKPLYKLYNPVINKWIDKKSKNKKNPKKNEPSIVRAKAFCIALMQQSGKRNFINGHDLKRNDIMDFAQKTWGKPGRTIYNECLNIISEKNPINKCYKEDNPKEYEHGLKLYKEMFPD